MARGTTLVKLLDDLRAECRISLNPAHNRQNRDVQVKALQRKQEWFWNDFAWPHLRVDRFLDLAAGQRYYDLGSVRNAQGVLTGDLDITRITKIESRWASVYEPLRWGIDADAYGAYDSDLNLQAWPVQRVQITEDEQLEVWPVPNQDYDSVSLDGRLKITGIRQLKPFVADTDRADIDGQLLVLHCAAEYLASTGAKDAQLKLDQANALYLKLRGQLMPRRVHKMFGVNSDDCRRRGRPVAVYKSS
jgi:hypothetical protein